MKNLEIRFIESLKKKEEILNSVSVDTREGGDPNLISGYAAVFNSETEIYPGFNEKISKGAFSNSINQDIRALWSHDQSKILARTTNSTLLLREDEYGLYFEMKLPDTSLGRDLKTLISNRTITGMSFGFVPVEETWTRGDATKENPHIRTLNKVELYEISPVTWPAYTATNVYTGRELIQEKEKRWKEQDTENTKTNLNNYIHKIKNEERKSILFSKSLHCK